MDASDKFPLGDKKHRRLSAFMTTKLGETKLGTDGTFPDYFLRKVKENKCNVPSVPDLLHLRPTLRFPERTRVALRSDLAHDNH